MLNYYGIKGNATQGDGMSSKFAAEAKTVPAACFLRPSQLVIMLVGGGSHLSDTVDEWFVPRYRIATYRNGCLQESEQPLFPGYIIVVCSDVDALRAVLSKMPAFARLLGSDDSYIPLNDDEVAWICAFTQRDHRVIDPSVGYIAKGRITVVRGPLVGREARIVKINRRKGFALIRLRMCGREIETKIGLNIIKQEKALQRAAEG